MSEPACGCPHHPCPHCCPQSTCPPIPMSDYTDLVTRLRAFNDPQWTPTGQITDDAADAIEALTAQLAARDAACGHLPNQLVAKALAIHNTVYDAWMGLVTRDEIATLRAATFEVVE